MSTPPHKLEPSKNPYVLMPLLLVMWGSFAAVSKLLLDHLDSYQLMFSIYSVAIIVFSIIVIMKGRLTELKTWRPANFLLLLVCGTFTFLYDFLYMQSLTLIPAVEASMLNYLFPIFIVLFAVPFHGEKLTTSTMVSLAMGVLGTLLLVTKGDLASFHFTNLKGDLLAIGAAVSWGLFTNIIKKNTKDMLLSTFIITFTAFILSLGSLFVFSKPLMPSLMSVAGIFWLSFSNIILGFFLYFRALQHSPASLIASFTFFTPFITLAFIALMLGEQLMAVDYLAAMLILFSVPAQQAGKLFRRFKKKTLVNNL
ncbi:drug/metabolite transporter (DMT)-like permease [Paenibacillus phyllosphaerae]|uniref:Drug/metabolite transporter (DMT)-like permease n=1 Tax=Paenibacillus phyllosphaerae TaxID=274593 RepID=A0A7W5FNL4_9BACL|nr:DMT family transporter [Paenibacillus phyllosphaerae]MBB3111134.1 drug/metabolite transporter (DMT)-like permease [Paenibacillus phyllosphaerae]